MSVIFCGKTAACSRSSVAAAAVVAALFEEGLVGNGEPFGQGVEVLAWHAGQLGVSQRLEDVHLTGDRRSGWRQLQRIRPPARRWVCGTEHGSGLGRQWAS
ncbi:hypothetical protein GCM10009734_98020 [Nonomuraea bangladeshensis]